MTGTYGTSQEDKIRERELEINLNECNKLVDIIKKEEKAEQANYNFPEYLNNNINFVQLVKFMNYQDISRFVHYIGIMADEKEEMDTRHWESDQLNAFLNEMLNRGEL